MKPFEMVSGQIGIQQDKDHKDLFCLDLRGKYITDKAALDAAFNEGVEASAKRCEAEADQCLDDIIEGDKNGALVMRGYASALLTAAGDIRALTRPTDSTHPPPQPRTGDSDG